MNVRKMTIQDILDQLRKLGTQPFLHEIGESLSSEEKVDFLWSFMTQLVKNLERNSKQGDENILRRGHIAEFILQSRDGTFRGKKDYPDYSCPRCQGPGHCVSTSHEHLFFKCARCGNEFQIELKGG